VRIQAFIGDGPQVRDGSSAKVVFGRFFIGSGSGWVSLMVWQNLYHQ
jgi:hypothetical protein